MNYPLISSSSVERALGFDYISEKLKSFIQMSMTLDGFDELLKVEFENLEDELDLTQSFKELVEKGFRFNLEINRNLQHILDKTDIKGAVLLTDELNELKRALNIASSIKQFVKKEFKHSTESKYYNFCTQFSENEYIEKLLDDTLDDKGNVKDDASPELKEIRKRIQKTQNFLTKRVQIILLGAIKNGLTREDAQPTIRGGRMVIPLRTDTKRQLGGISHGESGTGQTSYVEPKELFEHNNDLQELLEEEGREIRKILLFLVTQISENKDSLELLANQLVKYDFIQSKALLAKEMSANKPKISRSKKHHLIQAFNPILVLKNGLKNTVAFEIELGEDNRILLLTGPNAGGKSILLKSFGLIQLMFQKGLLVPLSADSEMRLFSQFLVDIGDNQSVENELSTYSAHLNKMKYFLENADENTLVMADEFGTGTEPDYGAAMAESILVELNKKKISGIFTTHFNNLKALAEKSQGIFNGAMLFNMETLTPTFRFKAGSPGSSFAFEIARNIGLSERVIKQAAEKIGSTRLNYDRSLLELQDKTRQLMDELESLRRKQSNLDDLKKNYSELKDNLDKRKDLVEKEAQKKALDMLAQTQYELKSLKTEFQKTPEPEKKLAIRKVIDDKVEILEEKVKITPKINRPLAVGDYAKHKYKGFEGEILDIKNGQVKLSHNGFEWKSKLDELEFVSQSEKRKEERRTGNVTSQMIDKRKSFSQDLDVRGKRTEEALNLTDLFINEAIMLGFDRVRILHGKGEGILRQMIRNQLKGMAQVGMVADEHVEFGGAGITVVELG